MNKTGHVVEGLARAATPSHKAHKQAPTPSVRMVKPPASLMKPADPFAMNPTLKGFSQAGVEDPAAYLPVRGFGRRMVDRFKDGEATGRTSDSYHANGIPAKRTPKAEVRRAR